jgi:hypothetical protein
VFRKEKRGCTIMCGIFMALEDHGAGLAIAIIPPINELSIAFHPEWTSKFQVDTLIIDTLHHRSYFA